MGRNGSSGVLTIYVSAAVVINRVEIKNVTKRRKKNDTSWPFGIAMK